MVEHPFLAPGPMSRPPYRAFLLRCWQESTDGDPGWRFTLVILGDEGAKRGFATLEELCAYLKKGLAHAASPGDAPDWARRYGD